MKSVKRTFAVLLCIATIICSLPFTASAQTADGLKLSLTETGYKTVRLTVPDNTESEAYSVQRSANGETWQDVTAGKNGYDLISKSANYFRLKSVNKQTAEEAFSSPVEVYPDASKYIKKNSFKIYRVPDDYSDPTWDSVSMIDWDLCEYDETKFIDGYQVYRGEFGSALKPYENLSANPFAEANYYYDRQPENSLAAYYSYKIVPYYYDTEGKLHLFDGSSKVFTVKYTSSKIAKLTRKRRSIKVKIPKFPGNVTKISVTLRERGAEVDIDDENFRKITKTVTLKPDKKTYTFKKLDLPNKRYSVTVVPYFGKLKGKGYKYVIDTYWHGLEFVKLKKHSTIPVINVRKKKARKEKSLKLTKNDKKLIKKFYREECKSVTEAHERAWAFNSYINSECVLDKKRKNKNLSDTKAIIVKKCATNRQSTRAIAKALCYLGYNVRIIKGKADFRRGKKKKVNHEWLEINILGKWYIIDIDLGYDYFYFCDKYSSINKNSYQDVHYYKNGKLAK